MFPRPMLAGVTSKVGTMSAFKVRLTDGWVGSLDGTVMCFSRCPRGMPTLTVNVNSVASPGANVAFLSAGTVQPQDGCGFLISNVPLPVLEITNLPASCWTEEVEPKSKTVVSN